MAADNNNNTTREESTLLSTAKSTTQDLYALLGLPSPLTQHATNEDPTTLSDSAIRKAYRRAALAHHPDKNPNNASAAAKFDEINKAYEILISPEARAAYDGRQRALREKAERTKAFEGKRKRMKEELERRESVGRRASGGGGGGGGADWPSTPGASPAAAAGKKRSFGFASPGAGATGTTPKVSEEKEAELRRLAAEGARRRQELAEKMKRRREQDFADGDERTHAEDSEKAAGTNGVDAAEGDSPGKRSFTFSTPSASTTGASTGANGSSLFASTMARLKDAERRRREGAASGGTTTPTEAQD